MIRTIYNLILSVPLIVLFLFLGCGEHIPVENGDPPNGRPGFGEEIFIQGPYFYDIDGLQSFLSQSNRLISVIFDSTATNNQLAQVAANFNLRLFPDLTRPSEVDWDVEKRRTSLWVIPEDTDISEYYTIFPRFEDDAAFFGWHPLVKKSFPSYADEDLIVRYFIDNRFYAYTTPELSESDIQDWNQFNGVEVIDSRQLSDRIEYSLRLTTNARLTTVLMANEYHENLFFLSATPDFIILDFND